MKALLRLFNAVLVDEKKKHRISKATVERAARNGYALDLHIKPSDELMDEIESIIGLSGEKANAAFHKSWTVVRDSSMEDLVIQQVVHYITTYGFEELGNYDKDTVYVPVEQLKLPKVKNIPLVVVRALTADEVLAKVAELGSGVALSQGVLDDILDVVKSLKVDAGFVGKIKNRELKTLLLEHCGLVPKEPVEFLRYLISQLTKESLLIKNDALIAKIKASDVKLLDGLLKDAPDDLASIFLRYKPLFLAMKSISGNKTFFNHLRKQADKQHKPLKPDYLNNVTCAIKHNTFSPTELGVKLGKASIYRKVRLARALEYRLSESDSIVYLVRNGKGWATEFGWLPVGLTAQALDIVLSSIAKDLCKNVGGKVVYIPTGVHYAIPATEKQFVGNLPLGSYVSVPQDLIVGIHWTNTERRIDLDLSVVGESGKIGWDRAYRSDDLAVLFSGDMTNASLPDGASEMFYVKKGVEEPKVLFANYYNFDADDKVNGKLFVANEKPRDFGMNYMVNPNSIVATADVTISKKQNVLGLVTSVKGENRVYFVNTSIGNSITSGNNERSTQTRKWLVNSMVNGLELNSLLVQAGAKVVSEKPKKLDIDLSPSALDKTTILNLMA